VKEKILTAVLTAGVIMIGSTALASSAQQSKKEKANIAIFQRSLNEFINEKKPESVDKYFDESYIQHNEEIAEMAKKQGISQRENTKRWFQYMMKAIPDLKAEIEHIMADGDKVFAFVKWSGRHTGGEFLGVPVTNKSIEIRTAEIMRLKDGRFVEHWDVTDQSKLFQALGFMKEKK